MSGVTEPKFTKCLTDVEGSLAVLAQQTLWSFYPLWNASTQNEEEVCQFSPTRATNRLP